MHAVAKTPEAMTILLILAATILQCAARAQVKTANLGVAVRVLNACEAGASDGSGGIGFGSMDFGVHYSLNNVIDIDGTAGNGAIRVRCVTGTPYRIAMNGGQYGTVPQRRMQGGPGNQPVAYNLYKNPARTVVWDEVSGVARSGNGQDQWTTVYARVPAQLTPSAGAYADVVMVTVTW